MTTATIFKNDVQLTLKEKTLNALSAIMDSAMPANVTVYNAVLETGKSKTATTPEDILLGAYAYAESFAAAGDPTDVFVCRKEITKGKVKGVRVSTYTRAQIAKKFLVSLTRDEWHGKIVTQMEGQAETETEAADDSDSEMEVI